MSRKVITIIGGSGFLGRLIARRYAKKGYEVRVAVRRPNQALFVRSYGEVGQVVPLQANIRDAASIERVVKGADIVVDTVGILYEDRFQKFDDVMGEDAGRAAQLAKAAGVRQFVYVSAIGADADSESKSARAKAQGEEEVLKAFPNALIVRPSIMFGAQEDIFNRFGKLARWSWLMPVVEGDSKFQPVYYDDVAEFIEKSLDDRRKGVFELGGGEVMSMREIVEISCQAARRKRWIFGLPRVFAVIMAWALQILQLVSLGIIKNRVLTPDQLKQLSVDNVVTGKDGLAAAKITAEDYQPIIEPFMEAYRPRGEFEELVKAGL